MENNLLTNLNHLCTTELGLVRIKKNLSLADGVDVVEWCKDKIKHANNIVRQGKNWYAYAGDAVITVNAGSFTIITAHRVKGGDTSN